MDHRNQYVSQIIFIIEVEPPALAARVIADVVTPSVEVNHIHGNLSQ